MARTIFQLSTRGDSRNGGTFTMRSRDVFAKRDDAEAYILQFETKCCDPRELFSAVPGTLKTLVSELDFHE